MPTYVIKPEELTALNFLAPDHPRPQQVEWINRGTNQKLRPSSVAMLQRTLFRDVLSPSVVRLHRSAGLRAIFRNDREREVFTAAFTAARDHFVQSMAYRVTAMFEDRESAALAMAELEESGVPEKSVALLWRAGQFMDPDMKWHEGHSALSVASAVAGSGLAGAVFGVAVLAIPGVGHAAAGAAVAASAFSSVATVGGAFGAAGGAMARMLSDHDVENISAAHYEQQPGGGKVFVSVDTRVAQTPRNAVRQILVRHGGRPANRA